jgi:hypothetical protein
MISHHMVVNLFERFRALYGVKLPSTCEFVTTHPVRDEAGVMDLYGKYVDAGL